jgi:hypothetical protein
VVAVALKVAAVEAAATVTDVGTVRVELVLVSVTLAPPLGAAPDRVTVHVAEDPEVRLAGEHCKPETVGMLDKITLIVPPVPVMFASVPLGNDPITLLIGSESRVALLVAERLAVTTATTPLLMAVAFIPDATHAKVPALELQLSVSPTAVSAGPATALREATAVGGYVSVHCSVAGALAPALNERLREGELPWTAVPEAKVKDAD